VADSGIIGAITGRAIYEGTLDFADGERAAEVADSGSRSGWNQLLDFFFGFLRQWPLTLTLSLRV
jgi:hypothetical protein